MSWMERAPRRWLPRAATRPRDPDRRRRQGAGRRRWHLQSSQGRRRAQWHRRSLASCDCRCHCKGALAGDGHSALILGKSGFYGAEQFLVGGVGGGKAAVGRPRRRFRNRCTSQGRRQCPLRPRRWHPWCTRRAQRRHSPLRWRTSTQRWGSTASSGEFISSMRLIICPWR